MPDARYGLTRSQWAMLGYLIEADGPVLLQDGRQSAPARVLVGKGYAEGEGGTTPDGQPKVRVVRATDAGRAAWAAREAKRRRRA